MVHRAMALRRHCGWGLLHRMSIVRGLGLRWLRRGSLVLLVAAVLGDGGTGCERAKRGRCKVSGFQRHFSVNAGMDRGAAG